MLEKKLLENKEIVDNALRMALSANRLGSKVTEAMQYAVLGGGKRIRAFLVRYFSELCGGTELAALPFAVAVEFGHAASLIHDDLPCMDNAALRHGKAACHIEFGEEIAVLAGDALLALAFKSVNENSYVSAEVSRCAVSILADKAGMKGMCLGQEMDLSKSCESIDELYQLYDLKTGSSLQAAAMLGVLAANKIPSEVTVSDVETYAKLLGRAFQIKDDLLDATKTEIETGKSSGIDRRNGTKTILSFISLQEAEQELAVITERAEMMFEDPILRQLPFYLAKREK